MGSVKDIRDVRAVASKALDHGATVTRRSTVSWDCSGVCLDPVTITLTGRNARRPGGIEWREPDPSKYATTDPRFWQTCHRSEKHQIVSGTRNNPLWVDITAPCRKCEKCRDKRRRLWRARAIAEIRASSRTWFGTLTLSPEQHYLMQCRAHRRLKLGAVKWSSLHQDDQLIEEHREVSIEITLWLKRVREQSKAALRILCVMEPHKSGLPHYHVLIHEAATPVVKSVLKSQWAAMGFSRWKLIPSEASEQQRAASYVAKYLMKTTRARVRASVDYGNPLKGIA